jgi:hypothetical protein
VDEIRIWNYNKSLLESQKGIKNAEIYLDELLLWQGEIKKGVGNEY